MSQFDKSTMAPSNGNISAIVIILIMMHMYPLGARVVARGRGCVAIHTSAPDVEVGVGSRHVAVPRLARWGARRGGPVAVIRTIGKTSAVGKSHAHLDSFSTFEIRVYIKPSQR
jgi:hypothetical protein